LKKLPQLKDFVNRKQFEDVHRPMFSRLDKDIPAGIVVFLVALPLCLGIALASGAPLISGLISGIVGGVVVGYISKSSTSVTGPAASVSAVIYLAIQDLERFELFLVALIIAGIIQLVLGAIKAGIIADYMPTSIIKGLLAGIGVILILSQLPYIFGIDIDESKLIAMSDDYIGNAGEVIGLFFSSFSPGSILLSALSLFILIYWDKTPLKNFKLLPPALFVVIFGVAINLLFKYTVPYFYLDGIHLVNIPKVDSVFSFFTFPDMGGFTNGKVWTTGLTVAIIASISSLLNIEATDNLDTLKRKTPPNRELIAQGIGNTLCGLLGGIAVTSVIVRSSVNIEAGAQTKLSTIIHGFLLLTSVLFLSSVINLIPLATLAAILLVVGYKLASVTVFKELFKRGWDQFIPFIATVFFIVVIDVLTGVLIGTAISLFFLLRNNYYNPFFVVNTKYIQDEVIKLELANEVSFFNKASIKNTLWSIPDNSKVLIDATFTSYIDQDVIDILKDFQNTVAAENNIRLNIIGLKDTYDVGEEINFFEKIKERKKQTTTPQEILSYLKAGHQVYASGSDNMQRYRNKELQEYRDTIPLAAVISCLDLKEPLHIVMNAEVGDLINIRSAGYIINKHVIRNAEFACRQQGAKLILLFGNTDNSIVAEALEDYLANRKNNNKTLIKEILKLPQFTEEYLRSKKPQELVNEIVEIQLELAKEKIYENSNFFKKNIPIGSVGIASATFDRASKKITFSKLYNPQ
jgi:carbonic anhydrase